MKKPSCAHACSAATRCATACIAGETRHPARSGLPVKLKVRARSRLTGSRTRGSPPAHQAAPLMWAIDVFVSRRWHRSTGTLLVGCLFGQSKRLQSRRLFTNHSAVGLIFHHRLRTLFGALFLPETRFGTRSGGLTRLSAQCRLLFGKPAPARVRCRANQLEGSGRTGYSINIWWFLKDFLTW